MKNAFKAKFKNNVLVKPLYKLRNRNKVEPKIVVSVNKTVDLDGHEISVKRDIVSHSGKVFKPKDIKRRKKILLCDECDKYNKDLFGAAFERKGNTNKDGIRASIFVDSIENIRKKSLEANRLVDMEDKTKKLVLADRKTTPCTWLRLYPLPSLPEETIGSVVLRCVACQLGLFTLLVLWACVWIFVIHSFEGPYEIQISLDFEKAQSQLVIDLATELRQITPLSSRWKAAIEQRIEEARHITSVAVMRGAKSRPGQYWDLSGTFLFAIYVMTALGFGAPVPQTITGRTAALVYAVVAVPTHFYLMYNASTCIVVHVEAYVSQIRCRLRDKIPFVHGKATLDNESPNCSRNSELLKAPSRVGIGRKIMRVLGVLGACRSVPLAGLLYYITGACVFGVMRGLGTLETVMFPLEFTTSRHLEYIPGHIRITYGFYVEGAMTLIACALATLRLHSCASMTRAAERYRLFATAD